MPILGLFSRPGHSTRPAAPAMPAAPDKLPPTWWATMVGPDSPEMVGWRSAQWVDTWGFLPADQLKPGRAFEVDDTTRDLMAKEHYHGGLANFWEPPLWMRDRDLGRSVTQAERDADAEANVAAYGAAEAAWWSGYGLGRDGLLASPPHGYSEDEARGFARGNEAGWEAKKAADRARKEAERAEAIEAMRSAELAEVLAGAAIEDHDAREDRGAWGGFGD